MKYVIDSKIYEKHIRDEVHLYGMLHQLAFLAGKAADDGDMENLMEMAQHYGAAAEEMFGGWHIPGRYLVFGDRADLAGLKEAELEPLAAVLKAHDRERKEKEQAIFSHGQDYIIHGSSFRLLVLDLFTLLGKYNWLRRRVLSLETEAQAGRLKKLLSRECRTIRRMYRCWGIPDDMDVTCQNMLQKAIEHTHLKPYDPDGAGCGEDGLYADFDFCGGEYE